ncbi:IN80E-like protein [Mya arenaria]|uniref:IN80E-like protein n=1 Tax=Mya arenaria TaxID=6604 RepID=A0ABY7DXE1_MYAAR|nr:INO80 complex subunit E-like [Mya arenaria]WAR01356.1 IN80E-like protein [Mya arenaria]
MDNQIDYKQKYKVLKKKLKFLVYEQECFLEELRKSQRRLLKVSRDRSFLLDRLLQYEKVDESSGDSDMTASSDSEPESLRPEGSSAKRKRSSLPAGFDPSAVLGGMGFTTIPQQGSSKKKAKTSIKKKPTKKQATSSNPMSRAELERHLESKQELFSIEKTPSFLPSEIFSNDNSNIDSDAMLEIKDEDDEDLIIDTPQ